MTTHSLNPCPYPMVGAYPIAATAVSLYPEAFVTVATAISAKSRRSDMQPQLCKSPETTETMKQQAPKAETQPEAKAGVQKLEAGTEPETKTVVAKVAARQQPRVTKGASRPGVLVLVKARAAVVCRSLRTCLVEGAEAACALENGRCRCTCGQCVACVYQHNCQGYTQGC